MRSKMLPLLLLSACPPIDKGDTGVESAPPLDTGPEILEVWSRGAAPWDPLGVTFDNGTVHAPTVRGPDGDEVELAPVSRRDETLAWTAVDGFEAGEATIVGFEGGDEGWSETFLVEPFGRDPAFTQGAVLDRVYEVDVNSLWAPLPKDVANLGVLLLDEQERLFVRISAPTDGTEGQVRLDLVAEMRETGAQCLLLRDEAALSETGELSWSEDELTVETASGEVTAWDIALHLGWLADGSAGGGLEGRATVDTRNISAAVSETSDPMELCALLGSVSSEGCLPCASDGAAACVDLRAYAGALAPAELVIDEDLPMCGLDLEGELPGGLPSFSCDMPEIDLDCGCKAPLTRGAALPVSLGLLAFLARRRRR